MRIHLSILSLGLLSFAPVTVLASDIPGHEGPWTAQAELGTVMNTGNSTSHNFNGKFSVEYESDDWYDKAKVESQYGDNEGERTEERYSLNGETRYRYSDKMYVFGRLELIKQHFKPYEEIYNEALGIGRRLIERPTFFLDVQLGPGGRHSKDASGDVVDEYVLDQSANAEWKITNTTLFKQELSTQVGDENTFSKSTSSIETRFVGQLGLKLSYVLEYNSNLPEESANKTHFDSTTSITMVYDF